MPYYATKTSRTSVIFKTWDDCRKYVIGKKGVQYKKFNTYKEAEAFLDDTHIKPISNIDEDIISVYVDGSYDSERHIYSYGVVIVDSKSKELIYTMKGIGDNPSFTSARNVAGELLGAKVAIDYCIRNNYKKINLLYDYEGICKWAIGAWRTYVPVSNSYREFIHDNRNKIEINFVKIKAHSGDKYNDKADRLAAEALLEV